jgi:LTXXQ motif family protein
MQSGFRLASFVVLSVAWLTATANAQPGNRAPTAAVPHAAPTPVPRVAPAPVPHAAPAVPHMAPQLAVPRAPPPPSPPHVSSAPRVTPQHERPGNVAPPAVTRSVPSARTSPSVPNQHIAAPHGQGNVANRSGTPTPASPANPQVRALNPPAGANVAGRVLRNPVLANRAANANAQSRVLAQSLAQSTFHGRFAARFGDRHRQRLRPAPVVIGFVGPLFWPFAYADFVDYSFYSYGYDAFWPYAYDDFYQGVFGNFVYGTGSAYAAVRPQVRGARNVELCSSEATALTDWPVTAIAQAVGPNDAQRAALDELRNAATRAVNVLKAACPTELPNTPTGRMGAMRVRLAAMLQAVRIVRPALTQFYQMLDDEQKARFNALGYGEEQDTSQARRDLTQVCSERAAGIADLPIERIEQAVHPDERQRSALDDLHSATAQAVELLRSNCPSYRPLTPVARVEAMEERLDLMLRAVDSVQSALTAFYRSLSDEKKEGFNRLTPGAG